MIWGPFLLALALGLIVSAGLYFAYLWPSVEPDDDDPEDAQLGDAPPAPPPADAGAAPPPSEEPATS